MTLKYRGISYQSNIATIQTPQTQGEAKYRGQSYPLRQSEIQVKHSQNPIIYRGVKYNYPENLSSSPTGLVINYLSV